MIKIILKGVLLWMTALSIALFLIGGCESLIEQGQWLAAGFWFIVNTALGYICWATLSFREFYTLSGCKWFNKITGLI